MSIEVHGEALEPAQKRLLAAVKQKFEAAIVSASRALMARRERVKLLGVGINFFAVADCPAETAALIHATADAATAYFRGSPSQAKGDWTDNQAKLAREFVFAQSREISAVGSVIFAQAEVDAKPIDAKRIEEVLAELADPRNEVPG